MVYGHPVGSTICVGTAVVTAMPTPYQAPPPTPFTQPLMNQQPMPHGHPYHPMGAVHPHFASHGYGATQSEGFDGPQTGFDMHLNLLRPECEQALVMLGARMSEDTCSSSEQEEAGNLFDSTFSPGASVRNFHELCQDDCVQKVLSAADDVALASHCNLQASQSRFSYILRNCPRGKWGHGTNAGTIILGVAVACLAVLIVLILWRYHLKQ
jgi:hypothetical protein